MYFTIQMAYRSASWGLFLLKWRKEQRLHFYNLESAPFELLVQFRCAIAAIKMVSLKLSAQASSIIISIIHQEP